MGNFLSSSHATSSYEYKMYLWNENEHKQFDLILEMHKDFDFSKSLYVSNRDHNAPPNRYEPCK